MKRILYSLLAITLALAAACKQETVEPVLQRNIDSMEFGYSAGSQTYVIKSNIAWTASSAESWITADPASGQGSDEQQVITVSVAQNDEAKREGTLVVSSGDKSVSLKVTQEDGYFYFDNAQIANAFEKNSPIKDEFITINYHKAKAGYLVDVTPTLSGDGAEGIEIKPIKGFELNPGEGTLSIPISGEPLSKGEFSVNLVLSIPSAGITRDIDLSSRVRLAGEVSVSAFKVLPRLAVFDWGEYARGEGTGNNGTPRSFLVYLLDKDGKVLREKALPTANWFISAAIFFKKNRFCFAGLNPDTDYIFRIIARELGSLKEDSDPTDLAFHTPAENIPANAILYKDFDDWWVGGCQIYQAFGVGGPAAENSWFRYNPDLSSDETKARADLITRNPCYGVQKLLNYATSKGGWVTSDTCPAVWSFFWEGDKYGTNYGDADYKGWQALINGSKGDIRHCAGSVLLGTNGGNPGWLRSPKLEALGTTPSNITATINTAPYIEPFSYESDLTHFIRVVGPGKIVSCETMTEQKSETEIVVKCQSNIDATTKDYNREYTIPTTHVVKIEGATGETRIEVCGGNGGHPVVILDDILVTKD